MRLPEKKKGLTKIYSNRNLTVTEDVTLTFIHNFLHNVANRQKHNRPGGVSKGDLYTEPHKHYIYRE